MLEIIEILSDPKDYFGNLNNRIELPVALVGIIYTILRAIHIDQNFYPHSVKPD